MDRGPQIRTQWSFPHKNEGGAPQAPAGPALALALLVPLLCTAALAGLFYFADTAAPFVRFAPLLAHGGLSAAAAGLYAWRPSPPLLKAALVLLGPLSTAGLFLLNGCSVRHAAGDAFLLAALGPGLLVLLRDAYWCSLLSLGLGAVACALCYLSLALETDGAPPAWCPFEPWHYAWPSSLVLVAGALALQWLAMSQCAAQLRAAARAGDEAQVAMDLLQAMAELDRDLMSDIGERLQTTEAGMTDTQARLVHILHRFQEYMHYLPDPLFNITSDAEATDNKGRCGARGDLLAHCSLLSPDVLSCLRGVVTGLRGA